MAQGIMLEAQVEDRAKHAFGRLDEEGQIDYRWVQGKPEQVDEFPLPSPEGSVPILIDAGMAGPFYKYVGLAADEVSASYLVHNYNEVYTAARDLLDAVARGDVRLETVGPDEPMALTGRGRAEILLHNLGSSIKYGHRWDAGKRG